MRELVLMIGGWRLVVICVSAASGLVGIGLAVRRANHTTSPLYRLATSSSPRLPCSTLACTFQQILPQKAVRLAGLLLVIVTLGWSRGGGGARATGTKHGGDDDGLAVAVDE